MPSLSMVTKGRIVWVESIGVPWSCTVMKLRADEAESRLARKSSWFTVDGGCGVGTTGGPPVQSRRVRLTSPAQGQLFWGAMAPGRTGSKLDAYEEATETA